LLELEREGRAELDERGAVEFEHALDLRYRGQSFEIRVPALADPAAAFERAHERLYGHALAGREVELVCLRTRALVRAPLPEPRAVRARPLPASAAATRRTLWIDGEHEAPVFDRTRLEPGHAFAGPALVEEYSGTTLVPPGWRASVTGGAHLLLERG
jgi:N-methylhydantoinase A